MADANKPKGTSEEGRVSKADKHNTASKGMAEHVRGGAGSGDPEAPEDADYRRPPGKDPTETGSPTER